jgi:outer membrane biosynthesis protein TonB
VEVTVTKEGKPYSERQRALIGKVCLAKAFRDAVFKVVPRALCKPIFDAAKKCAAGEVRSLGERLKKARAWVSSLHIDEARVLAALDLSEWDKATETHLDTLTGLKTAIKDAEVTIDEAFPAVAKAPEQPRGPAQATARAPAQTPAPTTPATPPQQPAQTAPPAPAAAPASPQPLSEEEQAEADAGLAPANPQPAQEPPPPPPPAPAAAPAPIPEPTPQPAATPVVEDMALRQDQYDTPATLAIKALAIRHGITLRQLWAWLVLKKVAQANQHSLTELASGKLANMTNERAWATWSVEMKKLPA